MRGVAPVVKIYKGEWHEFVPRLAFSEFLMQYHDPQLRWAFYFDHFELVFSSAILDRIRVVVLACNGVSELGGGGNSANILSLVACCFLGTFFSHTKPSP
jgi:hypothetical protein